MSATIYIGGWARFRHDSNVMKKEPVEDFTWMGQQTSEFLPDLRWIINGAADFEECRDELDRIPGAREYLKTYVAKEEGEGLNFRDPIGEQIVLGDHHSGASFSTLLWDYHYLLNDWDGWVLKRKEYAAFQQYSQVQVEPRIIVQLWCSTDDMVMKRGDCSPQREQELLVRARAFGLLGSLKENHQILAHLYMEHMARMALENEQQKKRDHSNLIGGLKWKYKHPSRWFDTPYGSTIWPTTPQCITEEAYAEMEALYPGYRQHIQRIQKARVEFQLPVGVTRYSQAGEAYTKNLLIRLEIST
jgi:hypothetical protein